MPPSGRYYPSVCQSPVVSLQPASQASGLSQTEVQTDSKQKVYDWIRRKDESAEILKNHLIVLAFPEGPHERSQNQVDIVVVTPDSTSLRANTNHSFQLSVL